MKRKHYARSASAAQNAAKTLLANIRFAGVDNPIKTLVITSAVENEGKSTIAMHLAQAIATSGKTVLLVEADMRRRSLAGMLGVRGRAGLYSVLIGQATLDEAIVPSTPEGMFFLDCEPGIPSPSDVLASKRFRSFLADASERYDYVLFDTPPVGAFVDAAVLAALVDGTLLVVREGFAPRDAVAKTYDQLKKADATVLGVVMNFCDYQGASYGYGYESYEKGAGESQGAATQARAESAGSHAAHSRRGEAARQPVEPEPAAENPRAARPLVPASPSKAVDASRTGKRFSR
ncbi:MAG: CpsD/CapB family tyrosine-protein kinase [Coriobacteriia bacterium]|nr:CpsD/CapB family tyrosine-protein kinase [Coriobacteriia bacterium]MBS5478710.1 CpsD/CapB family tyrosine-protein kinase [Coriobacteriia bacterium]